MDVQLPLPGQTLHRLVILHDGQVIGEYERTQAEDIERKKTEIECALTQLLEIYRGKGKPFTVRWDGKRRVKSIRVDSKEVGQVPIECWHEPSWKAL